MLLNKHNLAVAEFTSKDKSRYTCQAIHVSQDGTIATDGHRLVVVSPAPGSDKAFPVVEGFTPVSGEFQPFNLSREAAKDIAGQIPKSTNTPIIRNAIIGQPGANGEVNIAVTDLDTAKVFKCKPVTGQFPNYKAVIPKDEYAVLRIAVNAGQLAQMAKAAGAFSDDQAETLVLSFYGPDRAVKMTASNSETKQTWTGVLMPIYMLKESKPAAKAEAETAAEPEPGAKP
jgi:hypothetical protein